VTVANLSPYRVEFAFDNYGLDESCALLKQPAANGFRYVVTPNVDHIIRYCEEPQYRALYADASYILLDSRFLVRLLGVFRKLPRGTEVCTGSDLTAALFTRVLNPDDRVVLVGGSAAQAELLSRRFGLQDLHHIEPPMGFIHSAAAFEKCVAAIEGLSPFRFCFLAVGSPQQEILAHRLKMRGRTYGTALCVGASINYLTGNEHRAPQWLQQCGLEWLYRLLHDPRRLAKRYLLRGPRIFWLLPRMKLLVRTAGTCSVTPSDMSLLRHKSAMP
jgi:exopolysaccharide biosynthesis WecB/TagA/CpsF family protein